MRWVLLDRARRRVGPLGSVTSIRIRLVLVIGPPVHAWTAMRAVWAGVIPIRALVRVLAPVRVFWDAQLRNTRGEDELGKVCQLYRFTFSLLFCDCVFSPLHPILVCF